MEIIEEGCPSVDLPFYSRTYNPPARANLIVGMPPSFLKSHLLEWWGMGFMQRFIPVSWDYTPEQINMIMRSIKADLHLRQKSYRGFLPQEKREVKIPLEIADKIEKRYTTRIVEDTTEYIKNYCAIRRIPFDPKEEAELPFRTQIRLQRFLKGLALARNPNAREVENEDYKLFKTIFPYMNLKLRHFITRKSKRHH